MKKRSSPPEYFVLNSENWFAHTSTTGSLTDDNMELCSRNMGFLTVPNFARYNYLR